MDTNEKVFYETLIIIVIIFAIFISFFIFSIVKYQRKNLTQHRQRLQAEIETLEKERKRIANDLHDELGPLLAAIKLNITSVSPITDEDGKVLETSSLHLDIIIQRLREIAVNLMPSTLLKNGFEKALIQYVSSIENKNKIAIKVFVSKNLKISQEKEINFYRICLEIIHNSIKHSNAKNLRIEVTENKHSVLLLSKDDGIGMDLKRSEEKGGLGLKNIISRAESMGGECVFISSPNEGLQIEIEIPFLK